MARGLVKVIIPDKKAITLPRTGTDSREGPIGAIKFAGLGRGPIGGELLRASLVGMLYD
eukprot:gene11037-2267_t